MKRHIGLLTLCVLLLGMLGWAAHDNWKYSAENKRHAELKTLSAFMEHGVKHYWLREFSRDGETYLCWAKPLPKSLVVVSSGSACYIFDSSGNMVDYTPNMSDNYDFQKKWINHPGQLLDLPSQFLSEQKE